MIAIAAWLSIPLAIAAWTWRLGTRARRRISLDTARTLAPRHPVWRHPPGMPKDGEPLSEAEKRALRSITNGVDA
jgi:hypothetical protein